MPRPEAPLSDQVASLKREFEQLKASHLRATDTLNDQANQLVQANERELRLKTEISRLNAQVASRDAAAARMLDTIQHQRDSLHGIQGKYEDVRNAKPSEGDLGYMVLTALRGPPKEIHANMLVADAEAKRLCEKESAEAVVLKRVAVWRPKSAAVREPAEA